MYCEVVNTGRAATVMRSRHPIAKVTALHVRDEDRFRALFVHRPPPPVNLIREPTDDPPSILESGDDEGPRGVELSDAIVDQLVLGRRTS